MRISKAFLVTLDFTLGGKFVEQMTRGYDWVNSDITQKHFPIIGTVKVKRDLYVVGLGEYMPDGDAVITKIDQLGLRAANSAETLTFGKQYPDEQLKYPIAGLGTFWVDGLGFRNVLVLFRFGTERYLGLGCFGSDWFQDARFLAARKGD